MPEPTQYLVSHREVLEMIVKSCNVHEGRWMLVVNFAFTAGNFGPDGASSLPGAVLAIANLGIQRAPDDAPVGLVIDAGEVNPKKKS